MTTPHDALERLLEAGENGSLDALCEQFDVELVSVFGSAVQEGVLAPQDLDVAVRFAPGVGRDVIGTVSALVEIVGTDKIDVMVLNDAGVVARSRALGPGARGLYESRPGLYALAQMAALTEEMETAFMRRRDLELLASR